MLNQYRHFKPLDLDSRVMARWYALNSLARAIERWHLLIANRDFVSRLQCLDRFSGSEGRNVAVPGTRARRNTGLDRPQPRVVLQSIRVGKPGPPVARIVGGRRQIKVRFGMNRRPQ